MLVNKREILQPMLDKIEAGWYIIKPSADDPCDIETEYIFLHRNSSRKVKLTIDNSFFQDSELKEIERIVTAEIMNAEPKPS